MNTEYPEIHLKKSGEKYDRYQLTKSCYVPEIDLIIPKGYITDFASVPQLFWGLIPPHCLAAMPSVVHDFLYERTAEMSRKQVDMLFLKHLRESGVPKLQRLTMYGYVRALGWYHWNNYRKS